MFKKALAVILAGTMLLSLVGCGNSSDSKSKKDELVVFNAKGENASEFEEMCKAFSEETGIATKAFSVGSGEDSDEVLRAQMNQIPLQRFILFRLYGRCQNGKKVVA